MTVISHHHLAPIAMRPNIFTHHLMVYMCAYGDNTGT